MRRALYIWKMVILFSKKYYDSFWNLATGYEIGYAIQM